MYTQNPGPDAKISTIVETDGGNIKTTQNFKITGTGQSGLECMCTCTQGETYVHTPRIQHAHKRAHWSRTKLTDNLTHKPDTCHLAFGCKGKARQTQ